jgi:Raf kinase inhibitor-like YbhB/YbcL family protein
MAFIIESQAFKHGGLIPAKFTCDGEDVSPALTWDGPPQGTKSFALIYDDPDAPMGTWVHWVIYGIPAGKTGLPEGVPKDETFEGSMRQGLNSWHRIGYGGPCPPPGKPHRYFFKLHALDAELGLPAGLEKKELIEATKGHVIGRAEFHGLYERKG